MASTQEPTITDDEEMYITHIASKYPDIQGYIRWNKKMIQLPDDFELRLILMRGIQSLDPEERKKRLE